MNTRMAALGLLVSAAAMQSANAQTQPASGSQDMQVYAGYLFGDRLTKGSLSGDTPRLDNDAVYGARYTYHFTDQWGLQLSAGYSPSRAAHVATGNTNLGVPTVDVDAEWDILPNFTLAGHPFVPYAVAGAGYGWADLDHQLTGLAGRTPVAIADSNGYTANAGLGVKFFVSDKVFVDFDARYRYFSKLVSTDAHALNTAETTLAVGYRF